MITVEALYQAIYQVASEHHQHMNRTVIQKQLTDALGFILAQDIKSPMNIPQQNLSAMDGFAIYGQLDKATIVGESSAGKPYLGELKQGQGVRIFTGAVVPDECDFVVMQEHTNWQEIKQNLDKNNVYDVHLVTIPKLGANIRKQGEEVTTGECVLEVGKKINPTDISLLASLGFDNVSVYQPLVVGIIATGDELTNLGEPLTSLASIYNSNTPTLKSLLNDMPVIIKDYGIVPDDLEATCHAISQATRECDVLISSAGVSVGDYDYLTTAIDTLGKITHYKVAMKPGKPFVFGELYGKDGDENDKTILYFGLPGNPLSCVVGCLQFIKPALWQLSGVHEDDFPTRLVLKAKLTDDLFKKDGRKEFARALYHQGEDGVFYVKPLLNQDSHRIKQLSLANCLLVLQKDIGHLQAGDWVDIEPFTWLLS